MTHLSLDDLGDVDTVTGHPHLAQCAQCREALDDQRAVRDLLASLGGPVTAPPDVVSAVDAALRDAAPRDAALRDAEAAASRWPVPSADRSRGPDLDLDPAPLLGPRRPLRQVAGPPSRRRRVVTRAATVLGAVAAAGLVVTGLGHLPRGGSDSASGAATAASAHGGASTDSAAPSAEGLDGPGRPTVTGLRTGTRYTRAGLVQQASRLVPTSTGGYAAGGSVPAPAVASAVDGCLRAAAVVGTVQAVDDAAYEGRPATVVVVLVGTEQQVVVLPRDCSRRLGLVLATATLH